MNENFLYALKQIAPISEESLTELSNHCTNLSFGKDELVLKEHAVCEHIYFVSKGLVRIYYYKEEKEVSEWFAFENTFCLSIVSYFQKTPSNLMIQCLEDAEIIFISKAGLDTLRNSNFEIADFAYRLIAGSLILSQERMASIQFETALTRYKNLLKLHKNLLQRIPLNYIASYLGVSAETLSRIRAQIN
ncbi:MAG: Crp/Fnr family transcriptional regulator [Chloroflexia bacterium]|nr:Crp/Fnr family transcriptional regulator [Chloroflexia bacterium]